MVEFHTLWPIGDESFRVLANGHSKRDRRLYAAEDEFTRPMLGDGLIVEPCREVTHGVDICAPPSATWSWLAQMMRGAGMYGWPKLECTPCRSASYLSTGLAPPRVGDRVGEIFELAVVEAGYELVWQARHGLQSLGFALDELTLDYRVSAQGPGCSRLTARMRASCHRLTTQICSRIVDVVDFSLPAHQLLSIKQLAEKAHCPAGTTATPRHNGRHQAAAFRPAGSSDAAFV